TDLGSTSPYTVSRAYAYLALGFLTKSRLSFGDDELFTLKYPDFKADSMDFYLSRAEKYAESLGDAAHTDWMLRLRALYWFADSDFERAFAMASDANRRRPSNQAAHIAGQTRLFQGIELLRRSRKTSSDADRRAALGFVEQASAILGPLVD